MLLHGIYFYWQHHEINFYKDQEETKSENCKFSVFSYKSGEFNVRFIEIHSVFSCVGIILLVKRRCTISSVLPSYTGSVASGSRCTCALYRCSCTLVSYVGWLELHGN